MCQIGRELRSRCPCKVKVKMAPETDGIKTPKFWQSILAEFLATFWLVLLGCSAWIQTDGQSTVILNKANNVTTGIPQASQV